MCISVCGQVGRRVSVDQGQKVSLHALDFELETGASLGWLKVNTCLVQKDLPFEEFKFCMGFYFPLFMVCHNVIK